MEQKKNTIDLRGLLLVVVAGAWIAGILLESWLPVPSIVLLLGATGALVGTAISWQHQQGRLIMLMILFLLIGAWRYEFAADDPQSIALFVGTGKMTIHGVVANNRSWRLERASSC